jgi:ribosomal protein L37AE/L43A
MSDGKISEDRCPKCGSHAVEGQRADGVTVWHCPSCGTDVIDAAAAEWKGGTYQASEVRLIKDGNEICALIGDNLVEGAAGFGSTVPEALRDLADQLVRFGVWISVTDPKNSAEPKA